MINNYYLTAGGGMLRLSDEFGMTSEGSLWLQYFKEADGFAPGVKVELYRDGGFVNALKELLPFTAFDYTGIKGELIASGGRLVVIGGKAPESLERAGEPETLESLLAATAKTDCCCNRWPLGDFLGELEYRFKTEYDYTAARRVFHALCHMGVARPSDKIISLFN